MWINEHLISFISISKGVSMEALANCIINTDFYGKYGVLIVKEEDRIILENPGYIRPGKEQMRRGGRYFLLWIMSRQWEQIRHGRIDYGNIKN